MTARAMKDSGVDWIGHIPAHWTLRRLKYVKQGPFQYGANEPALEDNRDWPRFIRITDLDDSGGLRDETFRSLAPNVAVPYLLRHGDLLLARSGATVGKAIRYRAEWGTACFAGYLIRLRPSSELVPEFLEMFTKSQIYWEQVQLGQVQATIENVSAEKYGQFLLPLPPLEEQARIANFLDAKTTAIDTLIAKQEQLLALLAEKRQGLITQAVTKGLDPNAPMKDSGIDWIGTVPAIWSVMPTRLLGWYRGGAGFPDDEQGQQGLELPFYKVRDLSDEAVRDDVLADADHTIDRTTARRLRAIVFPAETIVFAKVGAALLLQRFRTLGREACVDNNMMGWVLNPTRMMTKYALLATKLLRFDLIVNPGAVPSLNGSMFGRQPITVPPLAEQERIVDHVQQSLRSIDAARAKLTEQTAKLREYRQAIITAAVTGQLDVTSAPQTKAQSA